MSEVEGLSTLEVESMVRGYHVYKDLWTAVVVPEQWVAFSTFSPGGSAVHKTIYTLFCKVSPIPGMNLPVSIEWILPSNVLVTNKGNITIGRAVETNSSSTTSTCSISPNYLLTTSLPIIFAPIVNSDGGGYTCRASIRVPWLRQTLMQLSATIQIPVTTQANFQLKMFPVTHCSTWDVSKAQELDESIKKNIKEAVSSRCNCPFKSTAIYSGEFSCQRQACSSDNSCGVSTTSVGTVLYRAVVNGSSDLLKATQILDYVEEWRESTGSLLHNNFFRLRIYRKKKCTLRIGSFWDDEC